MTDTKYEAAVSTLTAMRKTHATLRIDPRQYEDIWLYGLLKAYGYEYHDGVWRPFISNPVQVYA